MRTHLNTLYVTTDGAYLHKRGETVSVRIEDDEKIRIPLHNLEGIVGFGRVSMSPSLMAACAEKNVTVSFLSTNGKFLASIVGYSPGNVLLRRQQYRLADDQKKAAEIAKDLVRAKIVNTRINVRRFVRDYPENHALEELEAVDLELGKLLVSAKTATDLDSVRGSEGAAAKVYFSKFTELITVPASEKEAWLMNGRSRRPPRDPINAMLSFAYTLLMHDVRSACEAVGLDAACGYLHRDRAGRPGLALDLMEELRPIVADRLVLSLINRRQVMASDFEFESGGAVTMNEKSRKTLLVAYQKRKNTEITHPFTGDKLSWGLVPHIQARLFARFLRGDLDAYPPFIWS